MSNKLMCKILSIQDLLSFGQCSNRVALPILSLFGIETVILPTMLLSTHTGGFKNVYTKDLSDEINPIYQSWQDNNIHFNAIYIGYLGDIKPIEKAIIEIQLFKKKDTIVFLILAFADNGKFYTGLTSVYLEKLKSLCFYADYIVANVTEAFLLMQYKFPPIINYVVIKEVINAMSKNFLTHIMITGIESEDKKICVAFHLYHSYQLIIFKENKILGNYHGTGNIFLSYLIGKYYYSNDMIISIQEAMNFVKESIIATKDDNFHQYGIKFEKVLKGLYEKAIDK